MRLWLNKFGIILNLKLLNVLPVGIKERKLEFYSWIQQGDTGFDKIQYFLSVCHKWWQDLTLIKSKKKENEMNVLPLA